MTVKQYLGVRYDLVMTPPSRFTDGRVHLLVYDTLNKCWYVSCVGFPSFHTVPVSEPRPVNCIRCDDMIKRVFG